ncbi:MAG: fibronectin type III domain-containing protein [Bacteroidetes bacterium]|nr:fibronectin type III domain-containing protein [Bacteroidota bacterium]
MPDYSDPFSNQLKIFLTLTDFTVPSYQVKLQFTLTGNGYSITTSSLLNLPVTTLSPGTPVEISGSDLAPYLATQNLVFNGIDVAEYELRKILPEGPCQICVEVIDFSNPNQAVLSNLACTQVWFSLNDPPLLNTPFCGNTITPTDPQGIIFSWTPLHMNSLHSAGTQYTFELFEIRPDGADPNQVVNSSLPIFMQVTDQSFINYSITEPQLQVGMSYAWRVRAQDIQGRDFFRNNGYSAVCTFTYGSVASSLADGIVLNLNSNGTGTRMGLAWWNVSSTFTHYKVEVRKTGNPDYEWFPFESEGGELKIYQLEPATQYECRVKGLIGDEYESEWSNTSVFTTQPTPDYACGSTTLPPKQQQFNPMLNALPGMTFGIGQFEMLVTDIEPVNAVLMPGHYRGTGKITVGFTMLNIRVKFDNILVDDNLMVRSGKVEAITEGIDAWLNDLNQTEPDYYVDGTITDFEWNDSTSLTVWVDGEPQTFAFPENGTLIIQDEEGMIYTFHDDGTWSVTSILIYSTDALAGSANYRVNFSAAEDQVYGFDQKEYSAWIADYEVIRLTDSSNYFVPFKSLSAGNQAGIGPNGTDYVNATVKSPETLSGLTFEAMVNNQPTPVNAEELTDSTYRLTLSGLNESCFIYAVHEGNRIGKLWVKVLPLIQKELVIVPVNNAMLAADAETIESELNKIYAQANVTFSVTIATAYTSASWDLNADNKLQNGDISLMTHYSEEMRLLRDQYFETNPEYDKDAYHLFVVPAFLDDNLAGYMVRGKGVGFLRSGEASHTTAHELAHGVFSLEHTFPEIPAGTSNNLLDYTSAPLNTGSGQTHLTQKQWYYMHQPLPAFSMFDDEEEGEYVLSIMDYKCIPAAIAKTTLNEYYTDLDDNVIFLSADYEPYAFVGNSEGLEQYYGRVAAIRRISDNKIFLPKRSELNNKYGYFSNHYGIYEEYVYEQFDETQNPVPLKIKITSACEYGIYRGTTEVSNGSFGDCESCADFIRDNTVASQTSYFEEVDPNFYTTPIDNSEAFWTGYNAAVDEAVLLINANIGNLTTAYPADLTTKIHIINYNQYATTTTEGIAGLHANELAEIELKLQDLYRTSHDHDQPIHFVVLFQYIDFIMVNQRWNNYAGDVIEQSDLDEYENVVLITIPYASPPLFNGTSPQKPEWMPGLSFDKPNLVNTSGLRASLYQPADFTTFIQDVFRETVKPYDTYTYAIDIYGRIQFSKLSLKEWISGKGQVNDIKLVYDANFEDYDHSLQIEHEQASAYQSSGNSYTQQANADFLASFREKEWAYESGDYQTQWISPYVNLLHYHIRQYHAHYVNHFITHEFDDYRIEYNLIDPGSVPAYAKINPLEDSEFLGLVDFFSLITSPFGGDVFFDAIGVIYVHVVDPDNTFEISTRTLTVVFPFIAGGAVKLGIEGIDAVATASLKKFGTKSLDDIILTTLNYQPSWLPNRVINGNLNNPVGLIGVYNRQLPDGTWVSDTKNALEALNFPETFASNFINESMDGFKMLNTNQFYWSDPDQFWAQFNTPWLDGLVANKADVVVLSDKTSDFLKYKWTKNSISGEVMFDIDQTTGKRILTGFGKEIQYMENLVSQGVYEWDAINGIYKYIGD